MTRIGINGFGRMGRLAFRVAWGREDVSIRHINEVKGGATTAAHLLEFDSVHGRWPKRIAATSESIFVEDSKIAFTDAAKPGDVPWEATGVDIVLECSGKLLTQESLQPYFSRGVRKVVVAAPVKQDALNIVMGVNDNLYDPQLHHVVTAASCTTNCLAPLVHVILKEGIGIENGLMTTIHSYTATQKPVDGPSKKDWRGGRAAAINIIPSTTGAAKAVGEVIPAVKGKLTGMSFRVPTPDVSVVDLTFRSSKDTSIEEIDALMKKASESYLKGILDYTREELVSTDFVHSKSSSIYDSLATVQNNLKGEKRFFKIVSWYDNEWGYSNRVVDLLRYMASKKA